MTENNTTQPFPLIAVSGDSYTCGRTYGEAFESEIAEVLAFYRDLFKWSEQQERILERVAVFAKHIAGFNAEYIDEMQGVADGAGVTLNDIVMLNARSEILSSMENECTAACFPKTAVLFENWDWAEGFADKSVMVHRTFSDGASALIFTEAGILGKVGLNSHGIGIVINFLFSQATPDGVPAHILLRSLLECSSLEEVTKRITTHGETLGLNVLAGDANGRFINYEMTGKNIHVHEVGDTPYTHTNHFLHESNKDPDKFLNSVGRLERMQELLAGTTDFSVASAQEILKDGEGDAPLLRAFKPNAHLGRAGTVASIVLDLPQRTLHVSPHVEGEDPVYGTYSL